LFEEGKKRSRVFFTGNTMIDSLKFYTERAEKSKILDELAISPGNFALVTLHRPSNVDTREGLSKIIDIFSGISNGKNDTEIVFPIHPRTRKMIDKFGLNKKFNTIKDLIITEPLGYLDFLKLMSSAKYVLTNSAGIQEETTSHKIPCTTLRENTERPITIDEGTNTRTGQRRHSILKTI